MYLCLVLFTVQMFVFCTNKVTCHELSGRWTTHEGQEFVFQSEGKALWLTRFGSQFDTVPFEYRLDCKAEPATIDLRNFSTGPYLAKHCSGFWNGRAILLSGCSTSPERTSGRGRRSLIVRRL